MSGYIYALQDELALAQDEIERLEALVAMQAGYLYQLANNIIPESFVVAQNTINEALTATSETVSAWQSKRDNEIQAESRTEALQDVGAMIAVRATIDELADYVASELRSYIGPMRDCPTRGDSATLSELKAWKESAISVMPDYQAIGKVLELGLGESVHDKILPAINKFKLENAELRKQLQFAESIGPFRE